MSKSQTKLIAIEDTAEPLGQERVVMAQYGRIHEDMNSEFDIAFWQAQSFEARLDAAWELVLLYHEMKGLPDSELEFQRSVGSFQRIRD
ncbi:MAG: hypothetical protein ABJA67_10615 [Chthonomonadales bacterium]